MRYMQYERSSLLTKYENYKFPEPKSFEEMVGFIKRNFTVIPVPVEELTAIHYEMAVENILHCTLGEEYNLSREDLEIYAFKILRDSNSEVYYCDAINSHALNSNEQLIILLEKNTGYIESRSSKLYAEARLYQGISRYDINAQTPVFLDYCSLLDRHKTSQLK